MRIDQFVSGEAIGVAVENEQMVFAVADAGCGIRADDVPHVMEDFYQKFYWKQFASEVERSAAGQVPNWRSPEFCEWMSKRGISGCAAGKNAGKESAVVG